MGLEDVLKVVNKAFKLRKAVDFDEYDLHIDLEPLTSVEEVKVLSAGKDLDGAEYTEALKRNTLAISIKRINDINLDGDDVSYVENGEKKNKSKFLFMQDYLGQWPSSLIDDLFNKFGNIIVEVDSRIREKAKFEMFELTSKPEPDKVGKFHKVVESDGTESMDKIELQNKKVEEEIAQADGAMASTEAAAIKEYTERQQG